MIASRFSEVHPGTVDQSVPAASPSPAPCAVVGLVVAFLAFLTGVEGEVVGLRLGDAVVGELLGADDVPAGDGMP